MAKPPILVEVTPLEPPATPPQKPPEESPAPISERLLSDDERRVEEFRRQIIAARKAKEAAEQPVPPPPMTDRQRKQIEAEIEAGRKTAARHAAAQAAQPVRPRDHSEGTNTPVFRPHNYTHEHPKKGHASA